MESASIVEIWKFGRNLRRLHRIDKRRFEAPDPDQGPFSEAIGETLGDLVVLHNTFSSLDTFLSDLDLRGTDPADRRLLLAMEYARRFIYDAAAEPQFFAEDIPETLLDLVEEGGKNPEQRIRDATLGVDSTRNAVILIVSEAVSEIKNAQKQKGANGEFTKGFWNTSGKITAGAIASGSVATATAFVVKYSDTIINMASRVPGGDVIKTIVEWILRVAN